MKTTKNTTTSNQGYRYDRKSGVAIPTRHQLIRYLQEIEGAELREILSQFDLKSNKKTVSALEGRLGRLCSAGVLALDQKNQYQMSRKLTLVTGRVEGHSDGYGFVISDEGGDDLYLHYKQMRKVLHGDRVLARVKSTDSRGRREGAVVEVLPDEDREIIGKYHTGRDFAFVTPKDSRYTRDIVIIEGGRITAKSDDMVMVRLTQHPVEYEYAAGELIEVLGADNAPGIEVEMALRTHEIPHVWPKGLLKGKTDEKAWPIPGIDQYRKDLTEIPLVTIDGADARDFDDAVFCEPNESGYRLIVAIADVSHYVSVGDALDTEAYHRATSVYFPDQVVPMLPEVLSNGVCSLNPHQKRATLVCDMNISSAGVIREYQFYQALIESKARLTYEQVNDIVVLRNAETRKHCEVTGDLEHLYGLFKCFLANRAKRGSIDFEIPEAQILFDDDRKITSIKARSRTDAHRIIEECMLAANVCAAQALQGKYGEHGLYRSHEGPKPEDLTDLRKFIGAFALKLDGGSKPSAKDYGRLLDQLADRPALKGVIQTVLLRSLSQAVYDTELTGHFALSYPIYTHFTSPIRRYSDLIVHRLLKSMLHVPGYNKAVPAKISMSEAGEQCSFAERRADDASREVMSRLKAEFMSQRLGQVFSGVVSGVREFGLFVQLDEIFIDGLIHVTNLGQDYYEYDSVMLELEGRRSGHRFKLGDRLEVVVVNVNLSESKIDFELAGKHSQGDATDNRRRNSPPGNRNSDRSARKPEPNSAKNKTPASRKAHKKQKHNSQNDKSLKNPNKKRKSKKN